MIRPVVAPKGKRILLIISIIYNNNFALFAIISNFRKYRIQMQITETIAKK